MIIDRKIEKYIIFHEEEIITALKKIDEYEMRVIFVVNESGMLKGILTDGDFRRWVLNQETVDMRMSVSGVANTEFTFCYIDESPEKIEAHFSYRVDYIPLVDDKMRLVAVASNAFR